MQTELPLLHINGVKGDEEPHQPTPRATRKKSEQCGASTPYWATMIRSPTAGYPMAGLKGTRFEDFILAAKKRAEDAIEQHKPRLTTLEKSLRDAAIRRRNDSRQHH